jgi:hypothetical protein
MTPPRICPDPEPPDCPLYEQRAIAPQESLRRAVLAERHRHGDSLTDLVRAEASLRPRPPVQPVLLPAPAPTPLPVSDAVKEVTR